MASSRKQPPLEPGGAANGERAPERCEAAIDRCARDNGTELEALSGAVAAQINGRVAAGERIAVALSGGIDSVVLLDLMARLAGRLRLDLSVVHVHHGLSTNADAWLEFCRGLAAAYSLPFAAERVAVDPYRQSGPEGAARAARYAAFGRADCDWIALAHHQDDQAETVILQLLRGAGPSGLAAMPAARSAGAGPGVLRPLLGATRAQIASYANARRLRWIEDESNADVTLDRNRVRHHVLPLLRQVRPDAAARIARSAGVLAEAADLLDALAAIDEAACLRSGRLDVEALATLPAPRGRNLLRFHLARSGVRSPEASALAELRRQLTTARRDAQLRLDIGDVRLMRYDGLLFVERRSNDPAPDFVRRWNGETAWTIPELGGSIEMQLSEGGGIARDVMARGAEIRVRAGGERLRLRPGGPRRALKDLFQEARIPPWERGRIPLVYCDGELACVPGIGVDVARRARAGEVGFDVRWRPLELR